MNTKIVKGEYLDVILRSPKTIFTSVDIALLWGEKRGGAARVRLNDYVRSGKLVRIYHGIYAKDKNYDRFEFATRIYTPSYISFETVLTRAGINFQFYETIFVASYVSRNIVADGQKISLVRMKNYCLTNSAGVENVNNVAIASPERAFLDRIYVSKDYHFDNLDVLNWKRVFEILPIYQNKKMKKKVQEYFKYYKNQNL